MVHWLNQNQGFVLGILTFLYVAATCVLVAISLFQAKLTRRSLHEAAEAERRRYRPLVIFDIYSEGIALYASLRNTGASSAFNLRLAIDPELFCEVRGKKRTCPLIGESVSFLAPSREIRDLCAFAGEFDRHFPEPIFTGTVTYDDAAGKTYEERFRIDLRAQRRLLQVGKPDAGRELEKIAKALQDLTSSRFNPLIRTITEDQYRKEQEEFLAEAEKQTVEEGKAPAATSAEESAATAPADAPAKPA